MKPSRRSTGSRASASASTPPRTSTATGTSTVSRRGPCLRPAGNLTSSVATRVEHGETSVFTDLRPGTTAATGSPSSSRTRSRASWPTAGWRTTPSTHGSVHRPHRVGGRDGEGVDSALTQVVTGYDSRGRPPASTQPTRTGTATCSRSTTLDRVVQVLPGPHVVPRRRQRRHLRPQAGPRRTSRLTGGACCERRTVRTHGR